MTLKEAGELLESKGKEWTTEWLAQAGPYEQSLDGQQQARLCREYVREKAQEELNHNPEVREAVRKLESERYRLNKKRERLDAERKAYEQFHDDIAALWEKCPQYKTLGELMSSPEAVELRKRYWQDEASKKRRAGGAEAMSRNVFKIQVGSAPSVQYFEIEDAPTSWIGGAGGAPKCVQCGKDLHIEWDTPKHGRVSCRCGHEKAI